MVFDQPAELLGIGHGVGAVRIAHQADVGPQRLARRLHACHRIAHRAVDHADPHLHRLEAAARHVVRQLAADAGRVRPAARGIGRHALGLAPAQQPPDRRAQRLAQQVPQRHVDAADRRHRDAAPAQDGEHMGVAQRVVIAHAVVEHFPQAVDVARVFANKNRRELVVDQRGQAVVVARAADLLLGLAIADQAAGGLDAHDGGVEGTDAPEVAQVLLCFGDWHVHPGGAD